MDRWMLSRLASAVRTLEGALEEYQFSVYAQTSYDLLWRDFCDWYLEAIKPTVGSDAAQRAVLRAVLDSILRLLHPVCPFVTEVLHEPLRRVPGGAGVPG
ncbi:MAG TPA: valine--tRNA ligase, partial [Phycisphaerales bacterium]|nr:valine--tRNA ligase [Phycisphaerales bacterium]